MPNANGAAVSEWIDPLAYPESNGAVLVNKLGIRDNAKLRRLEYAVGNARLRELKAVPIKGKFDLDHLKAIHKHIFQDMYEWAGKSRDEVYTDREIFFHKEGTLFALQSEIKKDAKALFGALEKESYLKGHEQDKEKFVDRITQYYVALNKIHPFIEGNGRATQEFFSQLAREAGYNIDYSKVDKGRWNLAARESAAGRTRGMNDVFDSIISPARAVAFDKMQPSEAVKRYPELRNAFLVLAQAKQLADSKFKNPDDQKRFFDMYRVRISEELHNGKEIAAPQRQQDKARTR